MFTYTNWRYEEDYRHYRLEYIMWKLWQIHQKPCQINRAIFWKVEQFHLVVKIVHALSTNMNLSILLYTIFICTFVCLPIYFIRWLYTIIYKTLLCYNSTSCVQIKIILPYFTWMMCYFISKYQNVPLVTQFEV